MSQSPTKSSCDSLLNGLFLLHKQTGMTSHDVVFSLRKILKTKQVGHIGTLDPMASGLLVCLVGESVKLSDFLMGSDKKYRLSLKLGVETDTWDSTGKVLKTSETVLKNEIVMEQILKLTGVLDLPIPMYSAKKIDGKKLYEVAREKIKKVDSSDSKTLEDMSDQDVFEGPQKQMQFWDLKISSVEFPTVSLEFWCSKGSFVRSWVYSLGKQLGVGAVMTSLERQAIGHFELKQAITLDQLRAQKALTESQMADQATSYFLNPWQGLQTRTVFELQVDEKNKLKNGLVAYTLANRLREAGLTGNIFCFFNQDLIGILSVLDVIEVKRIFVNSAAQ